MHLVLKSLLCLTSGLLVEVNNQGSSDLAWIKRNNKCVYQKWCVHSERPDDKKPKIDINKSFITISDCESYNFVFSCVEEHGKSIDKALESLFEQVINNSFHYTTSNCNWVLEDKLFCLQNSLVYQTKIMSRPAITIILNLLKLPLFSRVI